MRASTNVSRKDRNTVTLGDFRGVDLSSSPLDVSASRAVRMRNLLPGRGGNHKRHGWKSLLRICERVNGKDVFPQINGIFPFDGMYVIHAGNKFYLYGGSYSSYAVSLMDTCTYDGAKLQPSRLKDQRSMAFRAGDRLYIIGAGDYLVFGLFKGKYELRRVEGNEETYVPVTTSSIDDIMVADPTVVSVDPPNLLTDRRINKLVGKEITGLPATYKLDAAPNKKKEITVVIETYYGRSLTLTNANRDNETDQNGTALYEGEVSEENKRGSINYEGTVFLTGYAGTLKDGEEASKMYLTPSGLPNISVEFSADKYDEYPDYINNCTVGALFGVSGREDRLFLGGSPERPNVDFHSELARTDAKSGGGDTDFTYFSLDSWDVYGGSSSRIAGYVRMSDGTLAVVKQDGDRENGLFYVSGSSYSVTLSDGVSGTEEQFAVSSGAMCRGTISGAALANLSGDPLILTREGVYGLVFVSNLTTERGIRSRGGTVNGRLSETELSGACAVVFKNQYWLSVGGKVYVADAGHRVYDDTGENSSFGYEWWVLDNIPARTFAVNGDSLLFGTEDGYVCRFDGEFTDRTVFDSSAGQIGLSASGEYSKDRFSYAEDISSVIREGDRIEFSGTQDILSVFLAPDGYTLDGGRIRLSDQSLSAWIREGTEVYACGTDGTGLDAGTVYRVSDIRRAEASFSLTSGGESVVPSASGFSLVRKMNRKELYISGVDAFGQEFSVSEYKGSPILKFASVPSSTDMFAKITHARPVVAEWYSGLLSLGTGEDMKTLLSMTVTTEPDTHGKVKFGYVTRHGTSLEDAREAGNFSFAGLSFRDFSFESGFASAYTVKCFERNFGYIQFRFLSDTDTDFSVNRISFTYKLNAKNRGVN